MVEQWEDMMPAAYRPTPLGEYLLQCQAGEPMTVEMYDDKRVEPTIERWSVRDLGRGQVRGLVLFNDYGPNLPRLHGKEGDRDTVRRWLLSMGVPALRIGGRKKK